VADAVKNVILLVMEFDDDIHCRKKIFCHQSKRGRYDDIKKVFESLPKARFPVSNFKSLQVGNIKSHFVARMIATSPISMYLSVGSKSNCVCTAMDNCQ
jgi:hypothetical protein